MRRWTTSRRTEARDGWPSAAANAFPTPTPCGWSWIEGDRVDRAGAAEALAAMEKGVARRVEWPSSASPQPAPATVKRLQGTDPREYRLRVGDWRMRFHLAQTPFAFSASAT